MIFATRKSAKPIATLVSKSSIYQTIYYPCLSQTLVRNAPNRVEIFYGRRRSRPKASTVHGWLVKWRATFSGNERLRKEGIREMREAKAVREWKKQRKAARLAKAGVSRSFFCLWPTSLGKERRLQTSEGLSHVSQHSSTKPPSRKSTRRLTSPTHSPRPTPANSRRSSHNRQGATPHGSRKASYSSRGNTVRTAEKKR